MILVGRLTHQQRNRNTKERPLQASSDIIEWLAGEARRHIQFGMLTKDQGRAKRPRIGQFSLIPNARHHIQCAKTLSDVK